jgi:hypothetical protein
MPIQSKLRFFNRGGKDAVRLIKNYPPPPHDSELADAVAPNTLYDFNVEELDNIHQFRRQVRDAEYATDKIGAWSRILQDYISCGNTKLESTIAIFNLNAATDCVNFDTEYCQVEGHECFAARNERDFPKPLQYRRKQQILWDLLDAKTWARAFRRINNRKSKKFTVIRFSEAGDFRSRHDLHKADEIARLLSDMVDVYTYTASSWLDWSEASHLTVNQSGGSADAEFGARSYVVTENIGEIPDDAIHCPYDKTDGDVKCGSCRLCIDEDAPDVYVEFFSGSGN